MQIEYRNPKVEKLCKNKSKATKEFGKKVGDKLHLRLTQLEAFNNLGDVPNTPPFRRHRLGNNREGQFAINLTERYRLIIEPLNGDIEDLSSITIIEIEEVSNHYE